MNIAKIESAIELTLSKRYPEISQNREVAARFVRKISDLFTKERSAISENYFASAQMRAAYLAHFTLINCVKASLCLSELQLPQGRAPIKILDIGCGTAAALAAASAAFPERKLEMTGIDASAEILEDASEFLSNIANDTHRYRFINEKIALQGKNEICRGQKFDIAIAANLFNEFGNGSYSNFIQGITEKNIADDGHFIIIEPALKKTSRALMAQRDLIAKSPSCKIAAPCLHQKDCPMLSANDRDWCHFYAEWKPTQNSRSMDALVGTDRTHLKYSYLILKKSGTPPTPDYSLAHRVVSSPLKSKGKLEFVLCGSDGALRKIRRLDKDASFTNCAVEKTARGDVISCPGCLKISQSSEVKILRAFFEPAGAGR